MGISKGEEVMLGNGKTNQMDGFTYLDSIIDKADG